MAEAVKKEEPKKKGIFTKIKESVDDKEEQLAFLSTIVRLSVLVWSAGILTLAYVKLPAAFNIPEQKLDPTFIAQFSQEPWLLLEFKQQVKRKTVLMVVVRTFQKKIWSF